jgi:hypothetical protein
MGFQMGVQKYAWAGHDEAMCAPLVVLKLPGPTRAASYDFVGLTASPVPSS